MRGVTKALPGALCWVSAVTGWASAQPERYHWQGFWLHPDGAYWSTATAMDGDLPCGEVFFAGFPQDPVLWPDWNTNSVSLRPDGAGSCALTGADGGVQVGYVEWGSNNGDPVRWQGTAESVTIMVPGNPYWTGYLYACEGSQTVGRAVTLSGDSHVGLWVNHNPTQFVDLRPAGADWSRAYATDGAWQGGRAAYPVEGITAALWKGSAASFVDMGPGEYSDGWIHGMAPGTQVGEYMDLTKYAVLWHDTPESWITMSPSWAGAAALFATTGDLHVGWATRPGVHGAHAGIWHGDDPESFFDLHAFVPPEYADDGSTAYDVDVVDGVVFVAGSVNAPRAHAFMWVGVPIDEGDGGGPKSPSGLTKTRKP